MLSVTYAECHLCCVSLMLCVTYAECSYAECSYAERYLQIVTNAVGHLMLSVTHQPFMLSVVMLSVVMLSVVMLNVVMLSVAAPLKYLVSKNVRG
jgi:hypothetical protein